jgi:hypothetical protein
VLSALVFGDSGFLELTDEILPAAVREKLRIGRHDAVGSERTGILEVDFEPFLGAPRADVGEVGPFPARSASIASGSLWVT